MNLVAIIGNFLLITILGLLIAFSPLLIMVNLVIVLKSKRPIMNTLVLVAGITVPLLIVAAIAQVFLQPTTTISLGTLISKIKLPEIIDILFGVSLIIFGLKRANNYRRIGKTGKIKPLNPPLDEPKALFVFGFVKSLLSVTNIFAILFLIQLLKSINPGFLIGLSAFLWVLLVGLFPLFLALYFGQYQPKRLEKLNRQINDLLTTNLQLFIVVLMLCSGIYFLINGFLISYSG